MKLELTADRRVKRPARTEPSNANGQAVHGKQPSASRQGGQNPRAVAKTARAAAPSKRLQRKAAKTRRRASSATKTAMPPPSKRAPRVGVTAVAAGVPAAERARRRQANEEDQRTPFKRDRDRILYTNALRRLAGVTQVAADSEPHVFHNRLTHTLEIAQIARRIAERLARDNSEAALALGGIDPDVAEAAALAHDLGHPPFGHIAEELLDDLMCGEQKIRDGFEGNAQSFRIVTKLAVRNLHPGLDLTRATLNAILKYPRLQNEMIARNEMGRLFDGAGRLRLRAGVCQRATDECRGRDYGFATTSVTQYTMSKTSSEPVHPVGPSGP